MDRKESFMGCNCGYWWADLDEEGRPITSEYCHYEGPDEWAPCEQNGYEEYPEEDHSDDVEEYERWLHDETQRELDAGWPECEWI